MPVGGVRWSQEAHDYVFAPCPTTPPPIVPPSAAPPSYAAIFDDPTFNEYVFEAPNRVADIGPAYIYQHVRTLRGIQSTHTAPLGSRVPAASSGPAADLFLQAFGYDLEARQVIAEAGERSRTMGEFVRKMCEHGLPALEAKYLWYLRRTSPPRARFAETYIM